MADAQLQIPWQLDAESVRTLALGINGNPFAALGPHDTRAGRIIRGFLPSATKVELLRRSGISSRGRNPSARSVMATSNTARDVSADQRQNRR